jgi:hypothetical protein
MFSKFAGTTREQILAVPNPDKVGEGGLSAFE